MTTTAARSFALTFALALGTALAAGGACSSGGDGTLGGQGGAGAGAGAGGAIAGGTGGAGCPPRDDLVAAAPACNTVTNIANAVPFAAGTGAAPTPMGGKITDGIYQASRADGYGAGLTPSGRRLTIVVTDGGTRFLWAGDVLSADASSVIGSFRADTTMTVSGTQLLATTDCSSAATSPIPATLDFTATATQLVLAAAPNSSGGVAVTTYTRNGCAP
jgi:hypothetical protein